MAAGNDHHVYVPTAEAIGLTYNWWIYTNQKEIVAMITTKTLHSITATRLPKAVPLT